MEGKDRMSDLFLHYDHDPSFSPKLDKCYKPAIVVIKRKVYLVDTWKELFKLLLFLECFRSKDGMKRIEYDKDVRKVSGKLIISSSHDEGEMFTKFAPGLAVRVFQKDYNNLVILKLIEYYTKKTPDLYFLEYNDGAVPLNLEKAKKAKAEELRAKYGYKSGSTKHLIAHINGKVLSEEEKFYTRIEKEFDHLTLIGDVDLDEEGERLLKRYMQRILTSLRHDIDYRIPHEKVFAIGLVRVALKHYASKTFWPYVAKEYDTQVPVNCQARINDNFTRIIKKYGKPYDDNYPPTQNMCMHAFICNKCADQFFDYAFDFWRLDLSCNQENLITDDGEDLFDVLVDEIRRNGESNIPNVMIHTTMALKLNQRGCKIRFRRILRMIDDAFWNDTDFSGSSNRITRLFVEWKDKDSSAFVKERSRIGRKRQGGRGEKLLAKPTFMYEDGKLSLQLPRQRLRSYVEEDYPVWSIAVGVNSYQVEPELIQGRISWFTEECRIPVGFGELFDTFQISLASKSAQYHKWVIKEDPYRFFTSHGRGIEAGDYISKDVRQIIVRKPASLEYLNGTFVGEGDVSPEAYLYMLEPEDGDVLILNDEKAYSIGCPLREGVMGHYTANGVEAVAEGQRYPVVRAPERVFFKADQRSFKGTSLTILKNGKQIAFTQVSSHLYHEFRIEESLKDIYGYILDLNEYITEEGLYDVELRVPGLQSRRYRFCYIRSFDYEFLDAPYLFDDYGVITFPKELEIDRSRDWEIVDERKLLVFHLEEDGRDENPYVQNRTLSLPYAIEDVELKLCFELPVLYWKFRKDDTWSFKRPTDLALKDIPQRIYLEGTVDLSNAVLSVQNSSDLDSSELRTEHDSASGLFYFRSADLRTMLGRNQQTRQLRVSVGEKDTFFFNAICRSAVNNMTLSGDLLNGRIYGHFGIVGSSDYMVTVRHNGELIEEDIPLKNGDFSLNCEVEEGEYIIFLYELEDDDSGFGSISYELGQYTLTLRDIRNLSGKTAVIQSISGRNEQYNEELRLGRGRVYYINDLQPADITIAEDMYSYLHNFEEDDLSGFAFYKGELWCGNELTQTKAKVCNVIVCFDDMKDSSNVLINVIDEDGYKGPLLYNSNNASLLADDSEISAVARRKYLRTVDDDLYRISIVIRG